VVRDGDHAADQTVVVPDQGGSRGRPKKRLARLHRALDDDGPLPQSYYIARICEEFQCLPSDADRELRRQEVGWLEEIIEARHYAKAKALYDRSEDRPALVKGDPLMRLVEENEYEHAGDLIKRRRAARRLGHE
jgi:tRNA isopentenyl-2-thiomethyl-A-37 hydroxylase MiaE